MNYLIKPFFKHLKFLHNLNRTQLSNDTIKGLTVYAEDKNIDGEFSIYSRFTWHSINKENETIFLNKMSKITNLKYLFIETRSDKDELCGVGKKISKNEYITDHYRRFINKNDLLKKFEKLFDYKVIKPEPLIKSKKINVIFLGEGRDKKRIQELINKKNLNKKFTFLGSYPAEYMSEFFSCADALYISLKKAKIFSYTIPGKLQSYLACGKPIIGSLDGIGKKIIMDSRSGLCSNAEDHIKLSQNIIKLSEMSDEERNILSKNAIKYFKSNFEKEKLIDKLIEVFN